jgi:hypothetical protein
MRDSERVHLRAGIAVVAVLAVAVAGCGGGSDRGANRQEQVEKRGAAVMPFDQDLTTHIFRETGTGGVQTVVAKDAQATTQIALVRSHLREEAERFAAGDFSDPMAIHGMKMPGVDELRRNASRIRVAYTAVPRGARITYTTSDRAVVDALHDWFDAQLMDHGANAHA